MSLRISPLALLGTAALGILALTGSGCTGGGSPPASTPPDPTAIFGEPTTTATERPEPVGMSCNHEYFPLREGYHIQYQNTYPPSRGASGIGHYAQNVRRVTPTSVYLTTAFETTGEGAPIESNVEYRCIGGGLAAAGYIDTGSLARGGRAFNNYEIRTNSTEGEFLPRTIVPGTEWTSKFNVTMSPRDAAPAGSEERQLPTITMNIMTTRKAIRIERVVVPAGSYEAMKITSTTFFDGTPAVKGTEWWVKNVGMVKSTVDAGSGIENIITEATGVTVPR